MIGVAEMEKFDKWLGQHMGGADAVSKAIVRAVVLAAGGRVEFTAQQVMDILEGNVDLYRNRTATGWELVARSRQRCEKCGRWEPEPPL